MRQQRPLFGFWLVGLALAALPAPASAQYSRSYKYERFYDGAPLPRESVSFVVAAGGTRLDAIDGVVVRRRTSPEGGELLPGEHRFCVAFAAHDTYRTVTAGCRQIAARMEAGQAYVIRPLLAPGAFKPEILSLADPRAGAPVELPEQYRDLFWQTQIELAKELKSIERHFRGSRKPSGQAARIQQAHASRDERMRAWTAITPGAVVELQLAEASLVVVAERIEPERLIYHGLNDPDNTYAVARGDVEKVAVVAASAEEYRRR